MKKRFSIILLSFTLILSIIIPSVSASTEKDEKLPETKDETILTLVDEGHGVLSKKNEKSKGKKAYKVKKKDKDVYEVVEGKDLSFKYVLATSNDQFQAVEMKNVDTQNIEDIQNDERISDYIKEDILNITKQLEEQGQTADLTIYSPNLLEEPELAPNMYSAAASYQPTVYYTGYGSQRYKDEVLVINNYVSNTGERSFANSTYAKEQYNKLFSNIAKTALGEGASAALTNVPHAGIALKLVELFGSDPYVGGSTGDKIKVYFIEDKWRKYTSIMYPKSDYKLGAISEQFWLDLYVDKIESGVVRRKTQSTFMRNSDYIYTDKRAYQYKASLGYFNNKTTQHVFYGMTFWSAN
jgi:hypothetical protein